MEAFIGLEWFLEQKMEHPYLVKLILKYNDL